MTLSRAVYEKILRHGEAAYPEEACGFLLLTQNGVEAVPVTNAAAKMQAESGGEFTRNARDGYVMDPKEQLAVERAADAAGETVIGVYHSHPDVGAYFSHEDKKRALPFPPFDSPLYPKWLVADVKNGKGEGAKVFVWSEDTRDFVEEPLSIT